MRPTTIRNGPKLTISASGGHKLLQILSEPVNGLSRTITAWGGETLESCPVTERHRPGRQCLCVFFFGLSLHSFCIPSFLKFYGIFSNFFNCLLYFTLLLFYFFICSSFGGNPIVTFGIIQNSCSFFVIFPNQQIIFCSCLALFCLWQRNNMHWYSLHRIQHILLFFLFWPSLFPIKEPTPFQLHSNSNSMYFNVFELRDHHNMVIS